jgi:hypothetical protein
MKARSGTAVEVSSGGVYAVQVASQRSAAEARASFRALRAKFPNQLGGPPAVDRSDMGARIEAPGPQPLGDAGSLAQAAQQQPPTHPVA